MFDSLKSALKRLGRGIVGIVLSGIIVFVTKEPKLIMLAPIINAVGKWLRRQFNIPNIPF